MVIGVISDTHGVIDRAVHEAFDGVDFIIHGGDIGGDDVIPELESIAPVIACSGNVDGFELSGYPKRVATTVGDIKIGATHIGKMKGDFVEGVEEWIREEKLDLFVFGHSHWPHQSWHEDTLIVNPGSAGPKRTMVINPGSAGPKRFDLPRAIAKVTRTGNDNSTLKSELIKFG